MTHSWANWSGGVTCAPQALVMPRSEAEIVELVRQASRSGANIRVAGTGHSFVPLCATDGVLLSLDGLQGVLPTRWQDLLKRKNRVQEKERWPRSGPVQKFTRWANLSGHLA